MLVPGSEQLDDAAQVVWQHLHPDHGSHFGSAPRLELPQPVSLLYLTNDIFDRLLTLIDSAYCDDEQCGPQSLIHRFSLCPKRQAA